jgi:hypothetical protein
MGELPVQKMRLESAGYVSTAYRFSTNDTPTDRISVTAM